MFGGTRSADNDHITFVTSRLLGGVLLAAIISSTATGQEPAAATHHAGEERGPVVLDGVFDQDEWREGREVYTDESCTVLVKEFADNVYIGVRCSAVALPMVDLFVRPSDGNTFQFHVSSFRDERILVSDDLTESPWHSHLQVDWGANTIRWQRRVRDSLSAIGINGPKMLRQAAVPMEGIEYRIRASQFGNSLWLLRFHVSDFGIHGGPLVLPSNSSFESPDGWFQVDVSDHIDGYTQTSMTFGYWGGDYHSVRGTAISSTRVTLPAGR